MKKIKLITALAGISTLGLSSVITVASCDNNQTKTPYVRASVSGRTKTGVVTQKATITVTSYERANLSKLKIPNCEGLIFDAAWQGTGTQRKISCYASWSSTASKNVQIGSSDDSFSSVTCNIETEINTAKYIIAEISNDLRINSDARQGTITVHSYNNANLALLSPISVPNLKLVQGWNVQGDGKTATCKVSATTSAQVGPYVLNISSTSGQEFTTFPLNINILPLIPKLSMQANATDPNKYGNHGSLLDIKASQYKEVTFNNYGSKALTVQAGEDSKLLTNWEYQTYDSVSPYTPSNTWISISTDWDAFGLSMSHPDNKFILSAENKLSSQLKTFNIWLRAIHTVDTFDRAESDPILIHFHNAPKVGKGEIIGINDSGCITSFNSVPANTYDTIFIPQKVDNNDIRAIIGTPFYNVFDGKSDKGKCNNIIFDDRTTPLDIESTNFSGDSSLVFGDIYIGTGSHVIKVNGFTELMFFSVQTVTDSKLEFNGEINIIGGITYGVSKEGDGIGNGLLFSIFNESTKSTLTFQKSINILGPCSTFGGSSSAALFFSSYGYGAADATFLGDVNIKSTCTVTTDVRPSDGVKPAYFFSVYAGQVTMNVHLIFKGNVTIRDANCNISSIEISEGGGGAYFFSSKYNCAFDNPVVIERSSIILSALPYIWDGSNEQSFFHSVLPTDGKKPSIFLDDDFNENTFKCQHYLTVVIAPRMNVNWPSSTPNWGIA